MSPAVPVRQRLAGVVIGGSAGGIEALSTLLPALAPEIGVPVIIVLHLPRERPSLLSEIFGNLCRLPVREAQDKEPALPGVVYVAPPDYHLLLDRGPTLALSVDEPVHFSRPSIDVLFESAADALGAGALGIVLSGGNEDGARGLAAIGERGGVTVVQQPADARAALMPQAALAFGPVQHTLTAVEIAALLAGLGGAAR